jgi:NADH:ubiquinone oxidoreductase subunit C
MIKVIEDARKTAADRLVSITCLKEGEGFAIYYHFSKSDEPELKELKVGVAAGADVESIIPLFPNAELFESEATELYGVKFIGNPSSGKRLFLEER